MAVIKIVPMPGAKGDKGDDGATGAQGLQGPIGETGPAGADALWSYNGAWQSNATYAEGDLVTHDGQLYYATGVTTLGVTPDLDSNFDLIAAKGETGSQGLQGPEAPSLITSGTWDTKFKELNGIVDKDPPSFGIYPTTGNYYTIGDLVFYEFDIHVLSPETWGTDTSWEIELPFKISQIYSDSSLAGLTRQIGQGGLTMRADEPPFYEYSSGIGVIQDYEEGEILSIPVYLRARWISSDLTSKAGIYVNAPYGSIPPPTSNALQAFWLVRHDWPVNLTEGLVDEHTVYPTYVRLVVSGTYRKE